MRVHARSGRTARQILGRQAPCQVPYFLFDLLLHRAAKRTKMGTSNATETSLRLWSRSQSKVQRLKLPPESFVVAGLELRPPSRLLRLG
jgi:hypothetical protein